MNLLQTLRQHGQSVWLDGLERNLILTGQLERSIDNGLRGVISNFTSLERAIRERSYDCDLRATVRQPNINAQWIYEYLTVQDMQLTADLMKAVHNRTHAGDGFVNLDLPLQVALDPQATLTEARRLWQTVGWSNLMLKIPATAATMPVIEQLIYDGININVTLASLKFKIQNSKFKKRMQAPEFIYGECKKCFPRRAAQGKRRPCFKPLNLFMGILILNL